MHQIVLTSFTSGAAPPGIYMPIKLKTNSAGSNNLSQNVGFLVNALLILSVSSSEVDFVGVELGR